MQTHLCTQSMCFFVLGRQQLEGAGNAQGWTQLAGPFCHSKAESTIIQSKPHTALMTFSFPLKRRLSSTPPLSTNSFLLKRLSCWHSGLSRKALPSAVLVKEWSCGELRFRRLHGQGLLSLAGDARVSQAILWSATSAVPHWQRHAGWRTLVVCQSKAAKLLLPFPCTNATLDIELEQQTGKESWEQPEAYDMWKSATKTNASCAEPVNPTKSLHLPHGSSVSSLQKA